MNAVDNHQPAFTNGSASSGHRRSCPWTVAGGLRAAAGGLLGIALGASILAGCDEAPLFEPQGPHELDSLVVSPSDVVFTSAGEETALEVLSYNGSGPVHVARKSLSWRSGDPEVVEVDEVGTLTARGRGRSTVVVSAPCCNVEDSVSVTVRGANASAAPNLPEGFANIARHTFESREMEGFEARSSRYSVVPDPTSPVPGSKVGEKRYRVGDGGGADIALSRQVNSVTRALHLSMWVKVSDNFRNHRSGITKIFYAWSGGSPKMILTIRGDDLELQSLLRHAPASHGYARPNRGRGRLERGRWHLVEYLVRSSSAPGRSDGVMKWWLDGELVGEHTGLDTHNGGESLRWERVEWNTIWGGTGDRVTESDGDMYMRAADFLVAGR